MSASTNTLLVSLEIPYPGLSGNHSVKHGGGRHYLTKEAQAYRLAVARAVGPRKPLPGPLAVEFIAAPPDRRGRDQANVCKVVEDALTLAGVWADDSNKVIKRTTFTWTDVIPGGCIAVNIYNYKE